MSNINIYDRADIRKDIPACVIKVASDGILTEEQIININRHCPNWTKQVEQFFDVKTNKWRWRVVDRKGY